LSVALKFRGRLERDVTEDCSLDEFTGEAGEADDVAGEAGEADDVADPGVGAVGERASVVGPATSTSRYEPGGAACSACDTEVARMWVADDEAVCADCKTW
jgi:hypothetical protein